VPVPKLRAGTVSPDNPKRRYSIYILLALIRFGFVSDPLGSRLAAQRGQHMRPVRLAPPQDRNPRKHRRNRAWEVIR
jgi:hypothetical protein